MNEILAAGPRVRARHFLAFLAGVAAIQTLPDLPTPAVLAVLIALVAVAAFLRWSTVAALLAGFLWASSWAHMQVSDRLPAELEGAELHVEGHVASVPESGEGEVRFVFDIDRCIEPAGCQLPRRVRLTWYRTSADLKAGESWRFALRLKRPHGMMNPGGMDYELWLFAHGIGATGYVRDSGWNERLAERADRLGFQRWRQSLSDALLPVMQELRFAGILRALVFGDESGISPQQWDVLRRTGTAHLVAISGSHIALIAGWAFVLGLRLAAVLEVTRWSPMVFAAWLGFAAALVYSGLADFAIPTRRALVMIVVVMAAVLLRRPVRPFHLLLMAAFAVALADPLALLAAGFWLSFGAVAAILWVLAYRLRPPRTMNALWRVNWATALVLAPLLLWFFRQIPLASPVANFIAVPVFGVALIPLCLFGAALLAVYPPLAGWLFALADRLLAVLWRLLDALAGVPALQWVHAQPPLWSVLLASFGTFVLLAPRGFPSRWLGALMLLPALSWQPPGVPPGRAALSVLDVGQGLASVVRTQSHTLVFDTGPRFSDRFDTGSAVLWPYLLDQGIARIDTLVISHADNDHMGGTEGLSRLMRIDRIASSVPARMPVGGATACEAGQNWVWDGVRFEFLSPFDAWGSDNDRSCVLKITTGRQSALLPGDIERFTEDRLISRYGDGLRSDILVAPHHGSDTSSTLSFLQRVAPTCVLISSGYRNRFGFPSSKILRRYEALSAASLTTAESGAIEIELGSPDRMPKPVGYRDSYRRYWHWAH